MKIIKQSLLSAVIAAGLVTSGAYAADATNAAPAAQAAPEQTAPQMDVSDQQVNDFVTAYVAVQTLNQQYATQLQAMTDSPEKSQQLKQQAQTEMKAAITDTGLSLDEYKQIAQAANGSEQLRQRISAAINAGTQAPADK
jgi:hypothetical protein